MNFNLKWLNNNSRSWGEYLRHYDRALTRKVKEEDISKNWFAIKIKIRYIMQIGVVRQGKTRPNHQHDGGFKMEVILLEGLFPHGLKPHKIYEICIPECNYKKHLIENLPRGYESAIAICDRFFVDLKNLLFFLQRLPALDLLVIDISDLSYLDYIRDADELQDNLNWLYQHLEERAMQGCTCVVFLNYPFYDQIYKKIKRPEAIMVEAYSAKNKKYWEARITHPPELKGHAVFDLVADNVPSATRD